MVSILDRLLTLEPAVERVALAKRLLALDPLREASHLFLMNAYADNGERSMALQHYSGMPDLFEIRIECPTWTGNRATSPSINGR